MHSLLIQHTFELFKLNIVLTSPHPYLSVFQDYPPQWKPHNRAHITCSPYAKDVTLRQVTMLHATPRFGNSAWAVIIRLDGVICELYG